MRIHRLFSFASLAATIALAATASAQSGLVLSATSHNFVSVPEGSTAKYGVQVKNDSGKPFIFDLSLAGSSSFSKQTDCPATIPAGMACEIVFTYTAPSTSEWDNATFTIATNDASFPNGNTGSLKAHSVQGDAITINAQKHNFLTVAVGAAATPPFGLIISNGSQATVPFSYEATGDKAAFKMESNCPSSLQPGGQCSIVFAFVPTQKGWQSLKVALNTGSVPVAGGNTVTLIGQGS